LQVLGMAAMGVVAIDLNGHLLAELLPAGEAMAAAGATLVVMHHHAVADLGLRFADARSDCDDNSARFVPGNDRIGVGRQTRAAPRLALRPAVLMEVRSAHPGSLHLQHDLTWSRPRVREGHNLKGTLARENNALHGALRFAVLYENLSWFHTRREQDAEGA